MLKQKVESVLFIAARPIGLKRLAEVCGAEREELAAAVEELAAKYNVEGSGIRVLRHGSEVQMTTAPEAASIVQDFLKDETTGEMTRPSLEALTIIAYRGPMTKAELEQVRGVNCSLILRNLMMRGLVEAEGEHGDPRTTYRVTMDFVRFLGVSSIEDLPDYGKLRSHENVERVLTMAAAGAGSSPRGVAEGEALRGGETE
jgi:segregation and condensation protein B